MQRSQSIMSPIKFLAVRRSHRNKAEKQRRRPRQSIESATLLIFCLLASLIGCNFGEETAVSQLATSMPAPSPTAITSVPSLTPTLPTATATPTYTPTQIPPSSTPTATPNFTCPQSKANATLSKSENYQEFPVNLVTFLNAGGAIEQLPEVLDSLGIEHEIFPVDMNGDGMLELVLNVVVVSEDTGDFGTLVLQCRDESYQVIFNIWWGYYHFFDYTFSDDVNNDGNTDVIIVGGFAGSACALEPIILVWENWQIVDTTDHADLSLGCSSQDKILLEDIYGDGNKELIVSGFTISHLDYGPPRTITQTLTLQNLAYQLVSTEFGSPEYLVHLLDDAQRAFDSSDWVLAVQIYEEVAQNQSLPTVSSYNRPPPQFAEEWGVEADHPREYQQAFALFRLAAIHTALGNTAGADWALAQLQERFPEGIPGHEWTPLALLLVDSLQKGHTLKLSCDIVLMEIEKFYPELVSHYYWGANIAWYRNETICPFAAP